jgi:hypothetical protein
VSLESTYKSVSAESCLILDAVEGVNANAQGLVEAWKDRSTKGHHASQPVTEQRPVLVEYAINGYPALRFDGQRTFMHLDGTLLKSDEVSVFAVVTDAATAQSGLAHRELLSNWSGRDGNSVTSLFVGMTGEDSIRLSDAISGVGRIQDRHTPFILTATNGERGAMVFQQNRLVTSSSTRLPSRRLDTPWVIGQQGNIDGEYWIGDLAFLMVVNRQLTPEEIQSVQSTLIRRFKLPVSEVEEPTAPNPEQLALASLCLVLFNSNEFAFVD